MTNKQTKAQQAYKKIRKFLITGHFSHEKRMSLRSLASKLKMSVVPVSEAVRKLEQEGLLVTQPQSGIYLRRLKPDEKRQLNLVRQALEVQAARLVALRQPKKDLDSLRKLAVRIRKQLEQNRADLAANSDVEFHRKLVLAAGSPMLFKQYERTAVISMVCGISLPLRWSQEESPLHTNLIEALETGNPDKAAKAVFSHIKAENDFLGEIEVRRSNITQGLGQKLYLKAKQLIPGGTQLLSKRPEMFLPDQWPSYYSKAKGCFV